MSHGWQIRLQFTVGPLQVTGLKQAKLQGSGWVGQRAREEVGEVDGFECCVPIRMYCCGYNTGRVYPEEHVFALT